MSPSKVYTANLNHCPALLLPFLAPLLLAVSGCGPQDGIETYQVEKSPAHETTNANQQAAPQSRMLAAVVPQGNKAWFFKVVGPLAAIDRHRDEFLQFLGSLKLKADKNPDWQTPDGWQEGPGSGMRAATFSIADPSGSMELSVLSLPVNGDWNDYVASNVNRWLKQLQQTPLGKQAILNLVKKLPIGKSSTDSAQEGDTTSVEATWVELSGIMAGKPGMGMPGAGQAGAGGMPPGHPPIGSDSLSMGGSPQTTPPITFKKPADWKPGRTGGMRKAAFLVTKDKSQAEVTVIDLPIRGASGISDVAANVRRWAAQVGLQGLNDQQLTELTHPVEIDGIAGKLATLLGPKAEGSDAEGTEARSTGLLAAMIERNGVVWFFKFTGDRSLVESQREIFTDFLKSVKFSSSKNGQ